MKNELRQLLSLEALPSRRAIRKMFGCSEHMARILMGVVANRDAVRAALNEDEPLIENFESEMTETKNGITVSSPVAKTKEELLKRFELDPDYWDCTKFVCNEWGSSENYNRQAKAWLTRIGDIVDWETFKKQFIEDVKKQSPSVPLIKYEKSISGKLQEINIFDLHLGRLAWHEESGSNYDSKIARDRYFTALTKLLDAGREENIERVLLPVGNDFWNSDHHYPFPQTTAGTPQESDIRWQKSFRTGRGIIIDSIEMCKRVAPVDVIVIPGNHEEERMFYLGDLLEVKYENDPNVTINNSPSPRKYYQWGKVLLGFTHGKDAPYNRLLGLMPQEVPKLWAETKFRQWHLGHKHTSKKLLTNLEEDIGGITIKHFRTLTNGDSYEAKKGYFSLGGAEAMLWDKEHGCTTVSYYNL